jgi:hypothetical protein
MASTEECSRYKRMALWHGICDWSSSGNIIGRQIGITSYLGFTAIESEASWPKPSEAKEAAYGTGLRRLDNHGVGAESWLDLIRSGSQEALMPRDRVTCPTYPHARGPASPPRSGMHVHGTDHRHRREDAVDPSAVFWWRVSLRPSSMERARSTAE